MREQIAREESWSKRECLDLYMELIEYVGFKKIPVSERMKVIARDISITCYLNNIEPNLENFKNRVVRENKLLKYPIS